MSGCRPVPGATRPAHAASCAFKSPISGPCSAVPPIHDLGRWLALGGEKCRDHFTEQRPIRNLMLQYVPLPGFTQSARAVYCSNARLYNRTTADGAGWPAAQGPGVSPGPFTSGNVRLFTVLERKGGVQGRFLVFRRGADALATSLAFGFFGAAGNVDGHHHRHFRMQ